MEHERDRPARPRRRASWAGTPGGWCESRRAARADGRARRASARSTSPGSAPRSSRCGCSSEERERAPERRALRKRLARRTPAGPPALAGALMANNFIALIFTVVFARLLGASGYGSLGALLAAFAILVVPGLRAAGHGRPRGQRRGGRRGWRTPAPRSGAGWSGSACWWWRSVALGVILREPTASLVGVEQELGRRGDPAQRGDLAGDLRAARRAPGPRALRHRGLLARRRGGGPAGLRPGPLRRSAWA